MSHPDADSPAARTARRLVIAVHEAGEDMDALQRAYDQFIGANSPWTVAMLCEAALDHYADMANGIPQLAVLGLWVLGYTHEADTPDYSEVLDKALELGILEAYEATKPCGDECICADVGFPIKCHRRAK